MNSTAHQIIMNMIYKDIQPYFLILRDVRNDFLFVLKLYSCFGSMLSCSLAHVNLSDFESQRQSYCGSRLLLIFGPNS